MTKDPNVDWEGKYRALIAQLTNYPGLGVCGMGAEKPCTAEDRKTREYRHGWNEAEMSHSQDMRALIERAKEGLSRDL
jgi:hypothetical protein